MRADEPQISLWPIGCLRPDSAHKHPLIGEDQMVIEHRGCAGAGSGATERRLHARRQITRRMDARVCCCLASRLKSSGVMPSRVTNPCTAVAAAFRRGPPSNRCTRRPARPNTSAAASPAGPPPHNHHVHRFDLSHAERIASDSVSAPATFHAGNGSAPSHAAAPRARSSSVIRQSSSRVRNHASSSSWPMTTSS